MFVVKDVNEFWWPVTVHQPKADKPGETEPHTFEIQVRTVSRSTLREIEEEARQAESAWDAEARFDEFLKETITDWREIEDEDGKAIKFNDDALDRVLEHAWIRNAIRDAVFSALRGEARVKN